MIAYFTFRLGRPSLVSAPIIAVYGANPVTRIAGWFADLLAIVAIAIGLGGSIAMGVFQIEEGVRALFGLEGAGDWIGYGVFIALFAAYIPRFWWI